MVNFNKIKSISNTIKDANTEKSRFKIFQFKRPSSVHSLGKYLVPLGYIFQSDYMHNTIINKFKKFKLITTKETPETSKS